MMAMLTQVETPLLIRRIIIIAELCLIGIIFFVLSRTVIVFVTSQSVWTVTSIERSLNPVAPQTTVWDYDFTVDPFHQETPVVISDVGEGTPETTLNLKLFGLRTGADGSAILQTPDGAQGVYKVGDEIISDVTLKAVNAHYIVLSQNGQLERLTFEGRDETGLKTMPEVQQSQFITSKIGQMPIKAMSSGELLSAITLTQVSDKGRVIGYRLSPKRADVNLAAFGLRSGDIITHIGPKDLTFARPEIGSLIAELSRAKSTQMKLIRGGNAITIKVGSP